MKNKLRSVNTHFWDDKFVTELDPIEKLIFLYLLTNPLTNLIGVYEISIKRIAFDTGIDKEMVYKIFARFDKLNKVYYDFGYVVLVNFAKNQNYNPNMEKSAYEIIKNLPQPVKDLIINKQINPLVTLSNGLLTIRKDEREDELESEDEKENIYKKEIQNLKKEIQTLKQKPKLIDPYKTPPKEQRVDLLNVTRQIPFWQQEEITDEQGHERVVRLSEELLQSYTINLVMRVINRNEDIVRKEISLFLREIELSREYFGTLNQIRTHLKNSLKKKYNAAK